LAIRFDALVRTGAVKSYAELATLGHVTTARVSQITRLLHLAPDIQEELLFYQHPALGRIVLLHRLATLRRSVTPETLLRSVANH
jgi:hypothetical protein